MSGGLGFGSGIARGISNAYLRHSEQQREDRLKKEQQSRQTHQALLPLALKTFEETGDASGLQTIFTALDPEIGKQFKKGGGPFDVLAPILTKPKAQTEAGALLAPGNDAIAAKLGPEQAPLESRQSAGISRPSGWTFGGTPLKSNEDLELDRTSARFRLAGRVYNEQRATDPDFSMDDARRAVGIPVSPVTRMGAQSVAGELEDGTPAFAIFDRAEQVYKDPQTGQPMAGFRPRTTTASTSLGTMTERAAKALGFPNATAAFKAGKSAELQSKIEELRTADSKASGLGSGEAKITTELNSPIGPTAAKDYNVAPTTTLKELAETKGLTSAQVEKIQSLSQIDELLTGIEAGIDAVFPEVQPGVWGRLKSQLSLGVQILGADEDLAALDSAVNAALAQVAQLSGQPGSRLSDTDLKLAQSTLAELKPSVFGGDTRATAKARLGVLRRLLEKAKANAPTRGAPMKSGAAQQTAPPGPKTGLTIGPDGKFYMDGVLLPTQP